MASSRAKRIVQMAIEEKCNGVDPGIFLVNSDGSLTRTIHNEDNNLQMNQDGSDLLVFEINDASLGLHVEENVTDENRPNLLSIDGDLIDNNSPFIDQEVLESQSNQIEETRPNLLSIDGDLFDNNSPFIDQEELESQSNQIEETRPNLLSVDGDLIDNNSPFIDQEELESQSNQIEETRPNLLIMDDVGLIDNQDTIDQEDKSKRQRKKRHQVDKMTWKVNKTKRDRSLGKAYFGKKKNEDGIWKYDINKKEREIKQRCKCARKDTSLIKCSTLTEDERKSNFNEFWKLDWEAKKVFVRMLTKRTVIQRPRDRKENTENSRRKFSSNYYLKKGTEQIRVCKTMFLNTLSIGEWTAVHWQKEDQAIESDHDDNLCHDDSDHEPTSKKLRKGNEVKSTEQFFNSLSKVESHYCRKRTTRLYLEPHWTSKKQLYKFYKEHWCTEKQIKPLSECKFSQIFSDQNLSLYRPKKDLCDICESFKTKNVDQEVYETHIMKKDEARVEKELDKANKECLVFTMDLQSLLLTPRSTVSSLYYKMKLSVHNFTLYNLDTKDGFCFLWNETEGGLTSNEFSTIISNFILSQLPLPEGKKRIILYSDGCSYQNRSTNLSNALLHLSSKNQLVIEQKYLEVGHTQMECDSMHSLIERKLKNVKINVPADYINICKQARKDPAGYSVKYLDHKYFKNFEKHQFFKSIRPGKNAGDPCVNDIRALQYVPDGTINFKLNFSEEWQPLPQRKDKKIEVMAIENMPNLYKERLAIKKRKYEDLQDLKSILESDYHAFYNNIPYMNK